MKKSASTLDLKHRADPIVFKLESTEFKSIFNESLDDLISIFNKYNYELRIAGGAVRYNFNSNCILLTIPKYSICSLFAVIC